MSMQYSGKTWNVRLDQHMPVLIYAHESEYCKWNWKTKIMHPIWVLDYTLTKFGKCRMGSSSAPWRTRGPRIAHLYQPEVPYWSDLRTAGIAVTRGAYIGFHNGEAAGLDRLCAGRGYAVFRDSSFLLGALLRATIRIGSVMDEKGYWLATARFFEILNLLNNSRKIEDGIYAIGRPRPSRTKSTLATVVTGFLKQRFTDKISVADIARHVGLGLSTFAHRYPAETGETPMETLSRLRSEYVKAMLLRGLPLKIIAEDAGYCDIYHLSKAFKRHEGMSPRDFKRLKTRFIAAGKRPTNTYS